MGTCEVGMDGEGDEVPLWLEVGFLVDKGAVDGRIHSISKLEERWEGFKKLLVFWSRRRMLVYISSLLSICGEVQKVGVRRSVTSRERVATWRRQRK
jgi:hypothetical protein